MSSGDRSAHRPFARSGLVILCVIAIFAVGVFPAWTWLGPRHPDITSYEPSEAPANPAKAGADACDPDRLAALPHSPKGAVQAERCAAERQDKERGDEALRQGTYAVHASEQAVLVSYQQAVISFWQAYAAVAAFAAALIAAFYAKRAADHMYDAAQAAIAANVINRAAMIADQRPWLSFEDVAFTGPLVIRHDKLELFVAFTVKNHGKSPAQAVNITPFAFEMSQQAQAVQRSSADRIAARRADIMFNTCIFPGDTHTFNAIFFLDMEGHSEEARKLMGSSRPIFIYGLIRYEDPNRDQTKVHHTGFVLQIIRRGLRKPTTPVSPPGELFIATANMRFEKWPEGWYAD
jgi:hypothetical protein